MVYYQLKKITKKNKRKIPGVLEKYLSIMPLSYKRVSDIN
jgi:hypothetical protein